MKTPPPHPRPAAPYILEMKYRAQDENGNEIAEEWRMEAVEAMVAVVLKTGLNMSLSLSVCLSVCPVTRPLNHRKI